MAWKPEMVAEDWRKEYEKIVLSKKYSVASTLIGMSLAEPNEANVRTAFGAVIDFIIYIPIGEVEKNKKRREELLKRLDEIEIILYGDPKIAEVQDLYKKYGVINRLERVGVQRVKKIQNLPELIKEIRNILIEAGDFATAIGMRIMLAKERKFGMKKILDEEGFEDLDLKPGSDEKDV